MSLYDVYLRQRHKRRLAIASLAVLLLLVMMSAYLFIFDKEEYQMLTLTDCGQLVIRVRRPVNIYTDEQIADNTLYYDTSRFVSYDIYQEGGILYIEEKNHFFGLRRHGDFPLNLVLVEKINNLSVNSISLSIGDVEIGDLSVECRDDVFIFNADLATAFIEAQDSFVDVEGSKIDELNAFCQSGFFNSRNSQFTTLNVQINNGDISVEDVDSDYSNLAVGTGNIFVSTKQVAAYYDTNVLAMAYSLENDQQERGIVDNVKSLNITAANGYVQLVYAAEEKEGGEENE